MAADSGAVLGWIGVVWNEWHRVTACCARWLDRKELSIIIAGLLLADIKWWTPINSSPAESFVVAASFCVHAQRRHAGFHRVHHREQGVRLWDEERGVRRAEHRPGERVDCSGRCVLRARKWLTARMRSTKHKICFAAYTPPCTFCVFFVVASVGSAHAPLLSFVVGGAKQITSCYDILFARDDGQQIR